MQLLKCLIKFWIEESQRYKFFKGLLIAQAFFTNDSDFSIVTSYNIMTLELGSKGGITLTCCARRPFPSPFRSFCSMLALKLDNSTKKPLQNNIERRKAVTRAVWPNLSVLDRKWSRNFRQWSWHEGLSQQVKTMGKIWRRWNEFFSFRNSVQN